MGDPVPRQHPFGQIEELSMRASTIMIANPKGGAGKSTLSIHLAACFACMGKKVCLGDMDRQQSSRNWLGVRPPALAPIHDWKTSEDDFRSPPKDCEVAILDTAAGTHGKRLKELMSEVDRVLVPVSPSRFDMMACADFFTELAALKAVRKEKVKVGMVGMRVNPQTAASRQLVEFLGRYDLPLITCIPQGQRYVNAADRGETIFDAKTLSSADLEIWSPLRAWV